MVYHRCKGTEKILQGSNTFGNIDTEPQCTSKSTLPLPMHMLHEKDYFSPLIRERYIPPALSTWHAIDLTTNFRSVFMY